MTNLSKLPDGRQAVLTAIFDPTTREKLDKGLVLWFPGMQFISSRSKKNIVIFFKVLEALPAKMFVNYKYMVAQL